MFTRMRRAGAGVNERMARAVLAPAIATMLADGRVDDSEVEQIHNLCSFSPIFSSFNQEQLRLMIKEDAIELERIGEDAAIANAARLLPPTLCETAFAFAARVAAADGKVEEREDEVLTKIVRLMGIPVEARDKILDVVIILQRGPRD